MTTGPVSYDIVVIGGGASGLMFAASLDMRGRRGAVLEKTGRTGTKLLMSGGGRCNITHGGMIRDFVSAYGESGPALRKCLYRHSNRELAGWLEDHGIALADEKGALADSSFIEDAGRVFPASMKASDVLLFTSVVEGTPHVVLEAVSNGLPVICFDTCGQGDIVDNRVGIKIPLSRPDQSESDFAKALNLLHNQPWLREEMCEACRERSSELSWDNKVAAMIEIYERTVISS